MIDLGTLFEQLEDIRDTSSRTEKEETLRDILDSPNEEVFKQLAAFVFNPYRKLNVRVTSDMLFDGESLCAPLVSHEEMWRDFLALLERLESGQITGNSARAQICSFISSVELGMGEWFAMFLNKELKIGVGRSTIDKLLPGVIPRFSVQLCAKYDGEPLPYPYMVQPKMDGARGVCGRFVDGKMVALSRNGRLFNNVGHILAQLERLEQVLDGRYVFDGEFFAGSWASSISIVRSERPVNVAGLKYYVFDAIPLCQWVAGRCEASLQDRDMILQVALQSIDADCLVAVPHKLAADPSELQAITTQYVADGWEGSVLKDPDSFYAYDRSDDWMKYKFVKDVDAAIIGVELGWLDEVTGSIIGEDDPRAADMASAIWAPVVRTLQVNPGNDVITGVGSGMTREQRHQFYDLHEKGVLVGLIAEVHFQDYTPDGKLLFPRFIRMREDKLTTS